ncbi:hypothetical protein VBS18_11015 [Klebsiella pneumoniae]|nr:hypothetical protein [Klebsiella pneumoniae]
MTDITELALLVSKAKASVFTLEYISQFEPADIDSDDVDLRFEVDGRDTGTNVSIVDECGQAAKVIGTLVEALEKAQRYTEELREWNAGLAQESCERQQRISELLQGKVGSALLERENHHVEVVGKLTEIITELESEVERWKQEAETLEHVAEKQLATAIELESRTVKLPDGWQFEECEIEGCENGAIFSVGTGSRNIHLCDKCAHEPQNSRLKKSPLSKRLPFKMSAGIKVEAE